MGKPIPPRQISASPAPEDIDPKSPLGFRVSSFKSNERERERKGENEGKDSEKEEAYQVSMKAAAGRPAERLRSAKFSLSHAHSQSSRLSRIRAKL